MPGIIVFELSAESLKAAAPTDPLNRIIPSPVAVEPQQAVAVYIEEGKELPSQYASTVKWQLPEGMKLAEVVGEGMVMSQGEYPVITAAKKGFVVALEKKLKVTPLYEVLHDVTKRHGNIETAASVLVHGSVGMGVKIVAGGDVEVRGLIEEASIAAGGSIIAKGGFSGGETGKLAAGKDLYCQFVQQGNIEAVGSVVVDGSVMNAHILCGKKLVVRGSGFLVGGKVLVREGIDVNRIGSEAAVATEIELGGNPFQVLQTEKLTAEVEAMEKDAATTQSAIFHFSNELQGEAPFNPNDPVTSLFSAADLMRKKGDEMPEDKKEALNKFGAGIMSLMRLRQQLEEERKALTESANQTGFFERAKLTVTKVAHPGTTIKIGDAIMRLDREYERAAFIYKKPQEGARHGEVAVSYI